MLPMTKIMTVLAWVIFISGCIYIGFVGEMLKSSLPAFHRVILSIGFILGAAAVSRWVTTLNISRNMKKNRRGRSQRGNIG